MLQMLVVAHTVGMLVNRHWRWFVAGRSCMCLFAVVAVICSDELVGVCSIVVVVMIELELVVVMLPCYMVGLMLQGIGTPGKGTSADGSGSQNWSSPSMAFSSACKGRGSWVRLALVGWNWKKLLFERSSCRLRWDLLQQFHPARVPQRSCSQPHGSASDHYLKGSMPPNRKLASAA